MSSLQDFAKLQLQPPGDLGAPVQQPVAPVPQEATPAPIGSPDVQIAAPVPGVGPIDPVVNAAAAEHMEPPAKHPDNAQALLKNEQDEQRKYNTTLDQNLVAQKKIAEDGAQLAGDKAAAQQPLYNQQTHLNEAAANEQAAVQQRLHVAGDAYAKDYGATVQAMQDKLDNQPHDVFGRAGVNKVSGIIGLILGGLGASATDGKNLAVERLNQLTDQKLAQDKYEYEMLGKKASMQTNVYAQLRQRGMDDVAASNAALAIKNSALIAQMKAVENSYAPQVAKNAAAQTIAQLSSQVDQAKFTGSQHVYGQAMQAEHVKLQRASLKQADDHFWAQLNLDTKIAAAKATAEKIPDVNPLAGAFNLPQNYAKDNPKQVEQLGNKLENLKAAFEIAKHYDSSSFLDHSARASDRLEFSHRSAMFDTGSNTVRKVNVIGTDREAGSSPGLFPGTQTGMTDLDVTGRMKHGLAKRAQVLQKAIRDIGNGASLTPETRRMIEEVNQFTRGYETDEQKTEAQNIFKKGVKRVGESLADAGRREDLNQTAQRLLEHLPGGA